ncbi:cyclin-A1-1-like [Humulus lupulus]|uniref:cyclin-A1-1-like n=1 Tax=Humulus lupulus TaxID=3486 RepID=UPI002B41123E|nr:cyclin-A1-1-like [Humulus lupulus]
MSTQNRRSSFSSSTSSSLAKRHASSSSSSSLSVENVRKVTAVAQQLAKKRAPLTNLTNRNNVPHCASKTNVPSSTLVPFATKKKEPSNVGTSGNKLPKSSTAKPSFSVPSKVVVTSLQRSDEAHPSIVAVPAPCSMDMSPTKSDSLSVSMDESMSTCDSFKSPEVEYVDNDDVRAVDSINRKTFSNLYISDHSESTENICNRDVLVEMEMDDTIVDVDNNFMDPQFCATIACDIYKHLRASEMKKRPSTDFMEKVQKDVTPSMRAILIDWLVEVSEEYRLVPDTLYLTVNYIDRYLSGNLMNRQRLQLLGVACMMIASKYEEICAPQVEEFCYITDNTYFKDEVLQMESSVLNFLKFEMTAPTTKCFLRRFVRAAQGINEVPLMQFECLANYLAELSLLEYSMLCYAPSMIAASAIFLAYFIIIPSKRPWNSTLHHYTQYQPSDLCSCIKELHRLCSNNNCSSLPAIREKYSHHKYKYVAKKYVPPIIPTEYFHDQSH